MPKAKPNIKPGNYARKALIQFERIDLAFKDTRTNIDDLNVLLESVADSAKFVLPFGGDVGIRMTPDEISLRMGNIFRLPFPETALEYSFDMECVNGLLSHKMLILCMEGFYNGTDIDFTSRHVNGFLITPFFIHNLAEKWVTLPQANWVSIESDSFMDIKPIDSCIDYGYKPDLDAKEYFSEVLGHATETIFNFIVASQMKNVDFISLPADPGLKKKGIKKGSLPFHDYIVLSMNIDAIEKHHRVYGCGNGEGTDHRAHAVSGHIKIRKTGTYWWNSHLRGNAAQGMVRKSYNVIKKNTTNTKGVQMKDITARPPQPPGGQTKMNKIGAPPEIDLDGYLRRSCSHPLIGIPSPTEEETNEQYMARVKALEGTKKCLNNMEGAADLFDKDAKHTFKEWQVIEAEGIERLGAVPSDSASSG